MYGHENLIYYPNKFIHTSGKLYNKTRLRICTLLKLKFQVINNDDNQNRIHSQNTRSVWGIIKCISSCVYNTHSGLFRLFLYDLSCERVLGRENNRHWSFSGSNSLLLFQVKLEFTLPWKLLIPHVEGYTAVSLKTAHILHMVEDTAGERTTFWPCTAVTRGWPLLN